MSVVRASVEALGIRALYADFGLEVELHVMSDATAAIRMVGWLGLGKVRHLAVSDLWVQEKARAGDIKYAKVPGKENTSDILTKAICAYDLERHLTSMGVIVLEGRAAIAPQAKRLDEAVGKP